MSFSIRRPYFYRGNQSREVQDDEVYTPNENLEIIKDAMNRVKHRPNAMSSDQFQRLLANSSLNPNINEASRKITEEMTRALELNDIVSPPKKPSFKNVFNITGVNEAYMNRNNNLEELDDILRQELEEDGFNEKLEQQKAKKVYVNKNLGISKEASMARGFNARKCGTSGGIRITQHGVSDFF